MASPSRRGSQLTFSFHRYQLIRADFPGGQITTDASLLPLPFDERHSLTCDPAARLGDPRQDDRVRHSSTPPNRPRSPNPRPSSSPRPSLVRKMPAPRGMQRLCSQHTLPAVVNSLLY